MLVIIKYMHAGITILSQKCNRAQKQLILAESTVSSPDVVYFKIDCQRHTSVLPFFLDETKYRYRRSKVDIRGHIGRQVASV